MNLEEKVLRFAEIKKQIDALEKEKKALSHSIMHEMHGKSIKVDKYNLCRHTRLLIKVSLEDARALDAIKLEEIVDKDKVKAYYELGNPVNGISVLDYLVLTEPKAKKRNDVDESYLSQ